MKIKNDDIRIIVAKNAIALRVLTDAMASPGVFRYSIGV